MFSVKMTKVANQKSYLLRNWIGSDPEMTIIDNKNAFCTIWDKNVSQVEIPWYI